MPEFIKKIIYWFSKKQIESIKKQSYTKRVKRAKSAKAHYSNSTTKTIYTSSGSLKLTMKTEENKAKLKGEIEAILRKYGNNADKLLEYVSEHGTPVYRISKAKYLLKQIKYEDGFIGKTCGIKALYINFIVGIFAQKKLNISTKAPEMFIIEKCEPDIYHTLQQFYKWYSMKLNLPGFDEESQQNFQKFLKAGKDTEIKKLSVDEILGLKEAIARDVEAINFVIDLAKSTVGAKQAMERLQNGSATV